MGDTHTAKEVKVEDVTAFVHRRGKEKTKTDKHKKTRKNEQKTDTHTHTRCLRKQHAFELLTEYKQGTFLDFKGT